MKASMTQRCYVGWQRYWKAEPWGAWRDNVHAALIAREVRRPYLRQGAKTDIKIFMLRSPEERQQEKTDGMMTAMRAMASTVTAEEANRIMAERRRKRDN